MTELVLFALFSVLFEKLADRAVKKIARDNGIDADIKQWKRSLTQIQGVLNHVSQKEINNASVKRWLNELQHLAYDIDDVLDDLATEAMHREFTNNSVSITNKVRNLIPSCYTNFSRGTRMHKELDDITTKLQDLVKEITDLGLRSVEEESRPIYRNRRLQTSMVHAPSIVGRKKEKDALVHELLEGESSSKSFSIVPIVGTGGVGKTTLARLLYHEKKLKNHFQLKAWVCVSGDFDNFAISKVIFESVTGVIRHFADLKLLQVALRDHLRDKRFLLVLDDVWSESSEDWDRLIDPFHSCAHGSKIIITTRKEHLLEHLSYGHPPKLRSLLDEDALSLFALHALGVNNFVSHLSLKPHALGIVKKCDGLPLALKALGRLLSMSKDEDYWKKASNSEIWNLPVEGEIITALKLSYHYLSAPLKRLFAYCSLFPKGYVFDKEELVLLWMAEGLLPKPEESMGHEFFDELLSRSFFQYAHNDKSCFVMHDMMNDLATYVASDFFVRLHSEEKKNDGKEMVENYRHMSFVCQRYVTYKKFEPFKTAKGLRTFLVTFLREVESWRPFYLSHYVMVNLLPQLPLLRVLCLRNFEISEVPESIGDLRHLRYLNLSRTKITHLPESVCNLYNLQTLMVVGCRSLVKLPSNFLKLKNMRHLDIGETPCLDRMPLGIGELKSLQTLSKIIIGGDGAFEISKLKNIESLCGKFSIMDLEKVKYASDAREANFSQKKLNELQVIWSDVFDGSRNEMLEKDVLNELKPCSDKLVQLIIRSYGGLDFPIWVGCPSFHVLKRVLISSCERCTSLPPLGQLPLLVELFIEGLNGLKVMGLELLGTGGTFPSLKLLNLSNMRGWETWSTNSGVVFPCLKRLKIKDCPNLVHVTLEALPSLNVLVIIGCDIGVLRKLVQVASSVTKLKIKGISGLNDVVWRSIMKYLVSVEYLSISRCNEIRYLWESEGVASLGEQEEDNCRSNILTSLKILKVFSSKNMECCSYLGNLNTLIIDNCTSLTTISLPIVGHKLKVLQYWGCEKLMEVLLGGQKKMDKNESNMPMLEAIYMCDWRNLKSVIDLSYLVNLTNLRISNCEGLVSFPENDLPNLKSLIHLEIRNCPYLDASFGLWPLNLCSLTIGALKKPISEWGPQNFPISLVELKLYGGKDGVSSCTQLSHLLPSSLTTLCIYKFEKLESVSTIEFQHLISLQYLFFSDCPNLYIMSHPYPHLKHLTSLQHLSFSDCPNMMDLPEGLLPSLLSLRIWDDCAKLKERCSKSTRGGYWPLISHIPRIN